MIVRPFTFITGMMFVLSGAAMFVVKHESQALDQQLSATNQATEQDEQSIRVLQAQWALEADPSRLASLAAQFTGLQPMKPGQLTTLASLGSALPAPGSAAPLSNPEDPVPALPQLAAATPAPAPAAPAAAPVRTAAATQTTPPAAKPVQLAAATAVKPRRHAALERLASAEATLHGLSGHHARIRHDDGSALYLASASSAAPRVAAVEAPSRMASIDAPSGAIPMGAQVMSVRAVAAPAMADDGGSMLGMAQGGSQ